MVKKIGFGVILWVIPFLCAVPLVSLMRSDPPFFKTIMIVVSSAVGCALAAKYFVDADRDLVPNFLTEGFVLGIVWIAVNWILDFAILLPLAGYSPGRYFLEIGLRYFAIVFTTTAIGYVLEKRAGGAR